MTPALENRLADLAARLGPSADRVWAALVRQAYIEGVFDLIRAAVALLLLLGSLAAGWWYFRHPPKAAESLGGVDRLGAGAVAAMLAFMFLVFFLDSLRYATCEFGNPEYFSLKELAKLFKP
jgi:hypothetical protein